MQIIDNTRRLAAILRYGNLPMQALLRESALRVGSGGTLAHSIEYLEPVMQNLQLMVQGSIDKNPSIPSFVYSGG